MAKETKELTVEERLEVLYELQTVLSKIDDIKTLRGELPLEVQDLEDEIEGLNTRIEKIKSDIAQLKTDVATKKVDIETSKSLIAKYTEQQENVRNNREYDLLGKEIEFQTLEVQLSEKRIKEFTSEQKVKDRKSVV